MVLVGEESGRLEELLKKTAEAYDEEVEVAAQKMTALLEPLMIVFMAIVVGLAASFLLFGYFDGFRRRALFRTLGLGVFQSAFAQGLTSDPLDKTISFTVVFLILTALPITVRTMFSRGALTVDA